MNYFSKEFFERVRRIFTSIQQLIVLIFQHLILFLKSRCVICLNSEEEKRMCFLYIVIIMKPTQNNYQIKRKEKEVELGFNIFR